MIKKGVTLFILVFAFGNTFAITDLLEVFQKAVISDPIYQQTVAQAYADQENLPIRLADLLPDLKFYASPSISKLRGSGGLVNNFLLPTSTTNRELEIKFDLKQPVFDFAKFSSLMSARATAKQACATINAALQNLMVRVVEAYFAVLEDEDNVNFHQQNKTVLQKQLGQIKELFKVGEKTKSDIYIAESALGSASSSYITAKTQLAIDQQFLRTLTEMNVVQLAKLNKKIRFVKPKPNNMDAWVDLALHQNWTIIADQFAAIAAKENVKREFANHLPVVEFEGEYEVQSLKSTASSILYSPHPTKIKDKTAYLNIVFPLFSGGGAVARTRQADCTYRAAQQHLENSVRTTMFNARQSYLSILSNLEKIPNDRSTIKSARVSLTNLQERYKVGSGNIIDVLNQQKLVLQAETSYITSRYGYIVNLIKLKNAAGTLSIQDLVVINSWLTPGYMA